MGIKNDINSSQTSRRAIFDLIDQVAGEKRTASPDKALIDIFNTCNAIGHGFNIAADPDDISLAAGMGGALLQRFASDIQNEPFIEG